MVCDFFYPRLGGVEMHIWSLSQSLLRLGHKVIVVTHQYKGRSGVRYMTNGLKVYYLPIAEFEDLVPGLKVDGVTVISFHNLLPLFRNILIREQISIVHAHQSCSPLTHEALLHAQTMGYTTLYTDHSLFGLNDLAAINLNKTLKFTLTNVDHAICVSHTCKENLVLRASLRASRVSVIPNAVDAVIFTPDLRVRNSLHPDVINVVIICRLVYRKGVDLLVDIIPEVCRQVSHVNFIIGGDGPKGLLLEEMVEKYQLYNRVEMLGQLTHAQVRETLVRGHIFLNCSLTESFCIAILEAASCGLFVVTTSVGGIPEVLPNDMVKLADKSSAESLTNALLSSLPLVKRVDPMEYHRRVKSMYHWKDVAERTVRLYDKLSKLPKKSFRSKLLSVIHVGPIAGLLAIALLAIDMLLLKVTEYFMPEKGIDRAIDFPTKNYMKNVKGYHTDDMHRKLSCRRSLRTITPNEVGP